MTAKRDDDEVEFTAQKKEDGTLYSVTVTCGKALTEEEFAGCLISFAHDILDLKFSFDDADVSVESSMN